MPNIHFNVNNKDFVAHLSKGYITVHGKDKKVCTCIITSDNPIRAYSGVCVKNPNDGMKYDENYGFHLAFKRALFYQYVIEVANNAVTTGKADNMHKIIKNWNIYFQKFRVPFGKALHEWYADGGEIPF